MMKGMARLGRLLFIWRWSLPDSARIVSRGAFYTSGAVAGGRVEGRRYRALFILTSQWWRLRSKRVSPRCAVFGWEQATQSERRTPARLTLEGA